MTQDEVNIIYDYLHENYRYEDGELIRKKDCKKSGLKKGFVLGSFFHSNSKAQLKCCITVNKKIYKPLSHLIYLFHNKKFPKFIEYLDENPMNCAISNIREINGTQKEGKKQVKKGYEVIETKNGLRYRVSISSKKKMHFGSYKTKEEALEIYNNAKQLHLTGMTEEEIKKSLKIKFPKLKIKSYKNKFSLPGVHANGIYFKSSIRINGKTKYLGSFLTPEEAHGAYLKAKNEATQTISG